MSMRWISIICVLVGLANSHICPDGKLCKRGVCCPRYLLSGPLYECCSDGCEILSGCYLAPKRPKLDRDNYILPSEPKAVLSRESSDRDILSPSFEPKDVSPINSNFDSSEEIADFQMGFFRNILDKLVDKGLEKITNKILPSYQRY
ncbi:unnamed protein product [Larinioides sclopetarius]|uniref:Uncharacterized protein n=1 Tax=Larinioides sclopetarius TaxID=280406 RepID=A0AAV2ATT9_9ARAC